MFNIWFAPRASSDVRSSLPPAPAHPTVLFRRAMGSLDASWRARRSEGGPAGEARPGLFAPMIVGLADRSSRRRWPRRAVPLFNMSIFSISNIRRAAVPSLYLFPFLRAWWLTIRSSTHFTAFTVLPLLTAPSLIPFCSSPARSGHEAVSCLYRHLAARAAAIFIRCKGNQEQARRCCTFSFLLGASISIDPTCYRHESGPVIPNVLLKKSRLHASSRWSRCCWPIGPPNSIPCHRHACIRSSTSAFSAWLATAAFLLLPAPAQAALTPRCGF